MDIDAKTCPDCAETVRAAARKCRFCGHEFAEAAVPPPLTPPLAAASSDAVPKTRTTDKVIAWSVAGVLGLILFSAVVAEKPEQPSATSAMSNPTDPLDDQAEALLEAVDGNGATAAPSVAEPPKSKWSYNTSRDAVRNADIKIASIVSDNEVSLDFPYAGGTSATMNIRQHPSYGLDIYFRVSPGQLQCSSYDGCSGQISIDGKSQRMSLVGPEDNDHEIVFVRNPASLLSKLKGSKEVIIELTLYQNGNPQWTFDSAGLKWPIKGD